MVDQLGCKNRRFGIIELVSDMATYEKRKMIPNTFGVPFSLFYLTLIL